ncbi:unnamed protein product [Bemisia tabaci]|uniref:KANL2-like probable zinc-finger domain-containing protein n=1 Tax=Bemisia tabaci TaxID=7038 RepID=A0A9P0A455_BEMTA|nr:unnamed protein product [Bemisia tabaci]
MFNINSINSSRFNGVLSYSTKKTTSRKDRKGCKKEKIDSILKDKMVSACRPPIQVSDKKQVKHIYPRLNHGLKTNRKPDPEPLDPYSFTEDAQQTKRYAKFHDEVNGQSSSLGHIISRQLKSGSTYRTSDDSSFTRRLNECVKPQPILKAVKPDSSANRSNLAFNFPQKCKVPEDCKYGSQTNVPTAENILPDFGKSIGKVALRPKRKLSSWRKDNGTKHEALQRIQDLLKQESQLQSDLFPLEFSSSEDEADIICDAKNLVEQCSLPSFPSVDRETRLSQIKNETCKKLQQTLIKLSSSNSCPPPLVSSIINAARVCPSQTAFLLNPQYNPSAKKDRSKSCLTVKRICCLDSCSSKAIPGARYCMQHILYSVDQQLFSHCSGKLNDNTQCHNPVFDIKNTFPLCPVHAKQIQDQPPIMHSIQVKKSKKKSKSLMSRHRGKKRRKIFSSDTNSSTSTSDIPESFTPMTQVPSVINAASAMIMRHGEEVFLTDASVPVHSSDLDSNVSSHCEMVQLEAEVTEELVNSRILDDHEDLTTVLNQLPADAFNDLFSDKNGQYVPTREETEELERALEQVDKDVRCLERMTRSNIGIYDNLHSPAIPEDLNLPLFTGYPNGYATSTVALTNSNPQKL